MPIADSPMTCVFRVCRILGAWPLRIESAAYFEGGGENQTLGSNSKAAAYIPELPDELLLLPRQKQRWG